MHDHSRADGGCPRCGAASINVQGILDCPRCAWCEARTGGERARADPSVTPDQ